MKFKKYTYTKIDVEGIKQYSCILIYIHAYYIQQTSWYKIRNINESISCLRTIHVIYLSYILMYNILQKIIDFCTNYAFLQ